MRPFHEYLCQQLDDMLKKRSVVVFYDPRSEFQPFFDRELPEVGKGYDNLPRVFIGERLTFVARYAGSFFGLRAAVEPIAALEKPEALIIYLPGVARDRQASVLMEMETGGTCYEPQLKRLALNVLTQEIYRRADRRDAAPDHRDLRRHRVVPRPGRRAEAGLCATHALRW